MMFMVIALDDSDGRTEVAVDSDGSMHPDFKNGELYKTREEAEAVARQFGGSVLTVSRVFDDDFDGE